jgi:hypothetical protein
MSYDICPRCAKPDFRCECKPPEPLAWIETAAEDIVDNIGLGSMTLTKYRPGLVAWVKSTLLRHAQTSNGDPNAGGK